MPLQLDELMEGMSPEDAKRFAELLEREIEQAAQRARGKVLSGREARIRGLVERIKQNYVNNGVLNTWAARRFLARELQPSLTGRGPDLTVGEVWDALIDDLASSHAQPSGSASATE
jgi:hypothetical protein